MTAENQEWDKTCNRFVAFFDIMGFKEMVERNEHEVIVQKLESLKVTLRHLDALQNDKRHVEFSETKSITFSDSIIFFSKGDTIGDANKIIFDSIFLIIMALDYGIPIKGALSFGKITVDIDNSLFFGRPIIDSYLLHDSLQLYTAVIDNHCELKFNELNLPMLVKTFFTEYKANFKTGRITHLILRPPYSYIQQQIDGVKKLKHTVSGGPRIYLDNTLDFLNTLKK